MRFAAKEFADDPCSSSKRANMIRAARALLSAVTRLLCVADMADVYRLLASLKLVSKTIRIVDEWMNEIVMNAWDFSYIHIYLIYSLSERFLRWMHSGPLTAMYLGGSFLYSEVTGGWLGSPTFGVCSVLNMLVFVPVCRWREDWRTLKEWTTLPICSTPSRILEMTWWILQNCQGNVKL